MFVLELFTSSFSLFSFNTSFLFCTPNLQILEGLLKLPENRECADCKAKYVSGWIWMILSGSQVNSKSSKELQIGSWNVDCLCIISFSGYIIMIIILWLTACTQLSSFYDNFLCRAPRWASVNLGIFICMQCSGIHRSLGVHISKVMLCSFSPWFGMSV